MPLLLPLLEILVPLVAAAICALAYAFAAPIMNAAKTGWNLFDNTIKWLTNKAIDLGIEFTKWIAPYFIEQVETLVNWIHHLGEFARYAAHFAYRNALSLNKFAHWVTTVYIPRELLGHQADTVTKAKIAVRSQPLSAAQVDRIESQIEYAIFKTQAAAIPGIVARPFPKINWSAKKWRQWLGLAAGAGALTLPGTTAWERTKWREQNKTNTKNAHRFRTLNWLLAFTGAAGLVAAGLAKLGLGWMSRCKNLKHIGPSFCSADLGSMIRLLEGLAVIVGEWSLLDFAKELQPLVVEGATEVRHFWTADVTAGLKDRQLGQAS